MKKIYFSLNLFLIILFTGSCTVKKFSSGQHFYNVLHDSTMHYETLKDLVKDSEKTADAYSNDTLNKIDTALINKIYKFDEGCYIVKIKEHELKLFPDKSRTVPEYPHQRNSKRYIDYKKTKTRPDTITVTTHRIANEADTSITNKIIYFVFLDNNRVLFHSPYKDKEKLFKSGRDSIDSKKFSPIPKTRGQSKKFVKETRKFFKLGFDYERNSVMRGYYKIQKKDSSLSVWLETYIEKKKIVLTRLNFKYFEDSVTNKIVKITFRDAFFRDSYINIKDTFESFGKEAGVAFKFFPAQFRLLLLKSDSLHIISKIKQTGTTREYQSMNSYDCREGCKKIDSLKLIETMNNRFTF